MMYAAAGNLSSWIAQFIGHGFAEGRAPALLDNLFQVISIALQRTNFSHFIWPRCSFGSKFSSCSDIELI